MPHHSEFVGEDEKLIQVYRRHWSSVFPVLAGWVVITAFCVYGFYALGRYRDQISAIGPIHLLVLALLALLALGTLISYVAFWVINQNRIILTDRNVYLVSQLSLFGHKVLQFGLDRLQDVTASQTGIIAHNLNYGDILIETAGELENFTFRHADNPHRISTELMEAHRKALERLESL